MLYPVQVDALRKDDAVARIARSRGAIDLAIGEGLARLFRGDRLLQLGYSREVDYARERLGVPPRTMFLWLKLARGLASRPVLRRAVRTGAVGVRKALAVLPAAVGEDERAWTAAAMAWTLAELEAAVGAPAEGSFEAETLWLRMTPEQQDRLDLGIVIAQEVMGFARPRWQCVEAMCQEFLGTFGAWAPEPVAPDPQAKAVARQLAAVDEALEEPDDSADPLALDARILRLLAARRRFDAVLGGLLAEIVRYRTWEILGYRSLGEYSRERLDLSERTVRQRVWLERKMCALPELREALESGRITYSKALLVAKDAGPGDVAERIREAASTTWQQLDRGSTAKEDRQNRAAGVRRLWGPRDAAGTIADAIVCARAWRKAAGEPVDAGEALALIADHFVSVWTEHLQKQRLPWDRRLVLQRHDGYCAVPGCSRPARHVHHVTFRSQGGSDDRENRVALCPAHHLRGVHRCYLEVAGRAGERLVWRFGTSEQWVTRGDDDVRITRGSRRARDGRAPRPSRSRPPPRGRAHTAGTA